MSSNPEASGTAAPSQTAGKTDSSAVVQHQGSCSTSSSGGHVDCKGSDATDQTCGDLHPHIQKLLAALPESGVGEIPIGHLLTDLQAKKPEVFRSIDALFVAATRVSGLSEEMALRWKEKGNEEYRKKQEVQAILSYTHGLLCAEKAETTAVLLNNRSTVFFEQRRYADACVDADQALRYNASYWKALQRRGCALKELGFSELGEKDIAASAAESAEQANSPETMTRVFGEATRGMSDTALPSRATVHKSIRVERNSKGRCLVATERLECGTLLEETPYALMARTETLLSVCAYCLQHTTCLYHGDEYRRNGMKSRGFFCSTACATAAWENYGKYESKHSFFLCCPNDALLAYRIILGLRSAASTTTLDADEAFDTVSSNTYGPTHIQTLQGNFSKELQSSAACGGCESIVAAIGVYVGALTEKEAELLRKTQRQILLNAFDVTCVLRTTASASTSGAGAESLAQTNSTTARLGKALYAVAAMLNHACDPNCFVSFVGNPQGSSARLVVRAIRPIMEGEELTISYGGISRFSFHSLRHRLQTLRDRYGFFCGCTTCRGQVDEPVMVGEKEQYIKASDYYQKGRRLLREGNCESAVTVLLQSYEIVMRYICPPPNPPQWMLIKTHDALALAYFQLKNREKCVDHLKEALHLDTEIHKTGNRVELVNEYTRLAFLAVAAEDKKKYAEQAVELLQRFYAPSTMLTLQVAYVESSYSATPHKN